MTVVLKRELNIDQLYDDIVEQFENFDACYDIGMTTDDITPDFLAQVFSELATNAKYLADK